MENMSVQHSELEGIPSEVQKEHKRYAVVAVSSGQGINEAFKQLGADEIVSGGQTMNPSSEDFINAFEKLDAENIFVFPNNKNIIMAAKQAAENYLKANVVVIATKSIAECYSALTMLDYNSDNINEIVENFQMAIDNVTSCSITYAVRDSLINDVNIKKGDYMAIVNNNILAANKDKVELVKDMLTKIEDIDYKEVMTIIFGQDVLPEELDSIKEFVNNHYPNMEIGEVDGKQDIYSFIIAIE